MHIARVCVCVCVVLHVLVVCCHDDTALCAVCVCVDVMQHIDCHDSAAVAADNADVTVSVLSVTDDGQVTVNINVYVSLQYPPVVWMHSPDDFVFTVCDTVTATC